MEIKGWERRELASLAHRFAQKLLKYLIREQSSAWGEARTMAVKREQAILRQSLRDLTGGSDEVVTKLTLKKR